MKGKEIELSFNGKVIKPVEHNQIFYSNDASAQTGTVQAMTNQLLKRAVEGTAKLVEMSEEKSERGTILRRMVFDTKEGGRVTLDREIKQ